jgi:hypothetical protein
LIGMFLLYNFVLGPLLRKKGAKQVQDDGVKKSSTNAAMPKENT